jgi:hypothetical protein
MIRNDSETHLLNGNVAKGLYHTIIYPITESQAGKIVGWGPAAC